MNQLKKLFPGGWMMFCPDCSEYISQSDPQNFSGRKTVIIDDEPCAQCKAKTAQEVLEAQQICGRLGVAEPTPLPPKEDVNFSGKADTYTRAAEKVRELLG